MKRGLTRCLGWSAVGVRVVRDVSDLSGSDFKDAFSFLDPVCPVVLLLLVCPPGPTRVLNGSYSRAVLCRTFGVRSVPVVVSVLGSLGVHLGRRTNVASTGVDGESFPSKSRSTRQSTQKYTSSSLVLGRNTVCVLVSSTPCPEVCLRLGLHYDGLKIIFFFFTSDRNV